jgi:hypothetical protein
MTTVALGIGSPESEFTSRPSNIAGCWATAALAVVMTARRKKKHFI